jgi:hypothetical protein
MLSSCSVSLLSIMGMREYLIAMMVMVVVAMMMVMVMVA